jgi:hypothetical protein
MKSRLHLVLVAAALTGCTSTPAGPIAFDGALRERVERSWTRGADFLVKRQNADGSWGSFESARPGEIYLDTVASHRAFGVATSALCVMALIEPSRHSVDAMETLQRGVAYLLATPPVGRASGQTFYDTWTHTYLLQAASMLIADDRFATRAEELRALAQRELGILRAQQGADGGFGYYDFGHSLPTPTGDLSTSFNTAAVLVAAQDAQAAGIEVDPALISDALAALERLRLPSGAYAYGTYTQLAPTAVYNRVKGSLGRSQPCNLALWLHQRGVDESHMRQGLENLRDEHHFILIGKGRPYPHEAWYATAGYYYLFGHYYAGRVVNQMPSSDRQAYAAWLADVMVKLQDADGAWFDFPLYGYHKCYGAAFGVLTLTECRRTLGDSIESLAGAVGP